MFRSNHARVTKTCMSPTQFHVGFNFKIQSEPISNLNKSILNFTFGLGSLVRTMLHPQGLLICSICWTRACSLYLLYSGTFLRLLGFWNLKNLSSESKHCVIFWVGSCYIHVTDLTLCLWLLVHSFQIIAKTNVVSIFKETIKTKSNTW